MKAFGFNLPDFLNLGVARPPPRGALAVAPRVALVPAFTLHDFIMTPRANTPLLLQGYVLPFAQLTSGTTFVPNQRTPLIPNPYAPQG